MVRERQLSGRAAVVPAIDTASSTAAVRSLSEHGVRTIAVSEHERPPAFASRHCDEALGVPDPTTDVASYAAALVDLAERPDVGTVLPLREVDVYALARARDDLAEHVGTPWPSLDTLRSVQDRVRLFDAARRAGVATPETRTLDEWSDPDRDVIVKPRFTVRAPEYADRFAAARPECGSTRYVAPDEPLRPVAIEAEFGHVPLVQEYVPSPDEYGFFALYDHGEAVATFQHRQRRGWKYCGGPSAYRESVDVPELEDAGRSLLDELEWHGVAMVEFLRDPETGEFKLMEVNPRLWSSLPFTIQAGVDFPALYWAQATGRPVETAPEYDVGVAGHLLAGEALHLASVLREEYPLVDRPSFLRRAGEVAASVARSPRFDYLDADDPAPFLRDLANRLSSVAGAVPTAYVGTDATSAPVRSDGLARADGAASVRADERPPAPRSERESDGDGEAGRPVDAVEATDPSSTERIVGDGGHALERDGS